MRQPAQQINRSSPGKTIDRGTEYYAGMEKGQAMKQARAFTLIELMVTLAIAAILMALAAPSFVSFIKNNRLTTTTNDLIGDLGLARSEAAKRGQRVTLCISTSGNSCTGGTDWLAGRLVFADPAGTGVVPNAASIIRLTDARSDGSVLSASGFASGSYITYTTTGTVSTGNTNVGTFKICDNRVGPFGKLVTITNTGRPLLATAQSCP